MRGVAGEFSCPKFLNKNYSVEKFDAPRWQSIGYDVLLTGGDAELRVGVNIDCPWIGRLLQP
jgi:hypothetical protein